MSPGPVAVVLPVRNQRHLLGRSLAALSLQTRPPAQVLVLDRGSADGLADWLRLRWPGVELCVDGFEAAIRCPAVALLEPGRRWPADHLARGRGIMAKAQAIARLAEAVPQPTADGVPVDGALVEAALTSLRPASSLFVIELEAAVRPAGALNLLGLALAAHAAGLDCGAATLATLDGRAVASLAAGTPLLVATTAALDQAHAKDQLCIEELVGRAGERPVRILVRAIAPAPPPQLSRLLDLITPHGDAELWVGDTVSRRYAVSLLGPERVRLVPPPLAALLPALRTITAQGLLPSPIAASALDPERRFADLPAWTSGYPLATAARLALPLARVLGLAPALQAPLLQELWVTCLAGFAALQRWPGPLATGDLDLGLVAAAAGIEVVPVASQGAGPQKKKTCDARLSPSQVQCSALSATEHAPAHPGAMCRKSQTA